MYDFGGVVGIVAIVKRVARICGVCMCRNILAGLQHLDMLNDALVVLTCLHQSAFQSVG